jgi:hypothetical protein
VAEVAHERRGGGVEGTAGIGAAEVGFGSPRDLDRWGGPDGSAGGVRRCHAAAPAEREDVALQEATVPTGSEAAGEVARGSERPDRLWGDA